MVMTTTYHTISVKGGIDVFYREAGSRSIPTILLLHGFPASSHQYRDLIPLLADRYHVIAPDFPGFGFTTIPNDYVLTFASLTDITAAFLSALGISKFAVYLFDIGAPVALRLAIERRFTITSMITQNGNAYEEGLGAFFDPIKRYWKSGSAADREFMLKNALTLPSMKAHYIDGVPEGQLQRMAPETWTLGYAQMMDRPGGTEIMLDVFYDYRTNVDLYPKFQAWLRETQVPLLAIWGKNDPSFIPPGAKAFKNDVKDAEIVFLDTGHYVLETHLNEAAEKILDFLGKQKTLRE